MGTGIQVALKALGALRIFWALRETWGCLEHWGVEITGSLGVPEPYWEHRDGTGGTEDTRLRWGNGVLEAERCREHWERYREQNRAGTGNTGGRTGKVPGAPAASAHARVLPNSKMAPRSPRPARSGGGASRGPIAAIGYWEPGAALLTNGEAGSAAAHGHVRGTGAGPEGGRRWRQRWRRSADWPWPPARPR